MTRYTIRRAALGDIDRLVAFTVQEAAEAEGQELSADEASRGVRGGFADPPLATYWVAETEDGEVVASTSVVAEWSNFHGGHYWWIQSIFIAPAHRGAGLVEMLLEHLTGAADSAGALDLRLYAHRANQRALRVYDRCGFEVGPYVMMRRRRAPGPE